MIRDHLYHKKMGTDHHFRWRGGEVTRLEGIADGVFAITLTLLIVSSAGVSGFNDVWAMVRDLPAFLASFALIMYIWLEHYLFFRRYGLIDGWSLFFNAAFLFVVMMMAYPLKLLTTFLWYLIIDIPTDTLFAITDVSIGVITGYEQRQYMMYFYGAAIIGVFGLLLLMHINAWLKRNSLKLDEQERLITIKSIMHHLISTLIAVISIITLWFTQNPGISGVVYFLMPILQPMIGLYYFNKLKKMSQE
jgi:uncharacterized membrane protein